jgi:hypothetical protein
MINSLRLGLLTLFLAMFSVTGYSQVCTGNQVTISLQNFTVHTSDVEFDVYVKNTSALNTLKLAGYQGNVQYSANALPAGATGGMEVVSMPSANGFTGFPDIVYAFVGLQTPSATRQMRWTQSPQSAANSVALPKDVDMKFVRLRFTSSLPLTQGAQLTFNFQTSTAGGAIPNSVLAFCNGNTGTTNNIQTSAGTLIQGAAVNITVPVSNVCATSGAASNVGNVTCFGGNNGSATVTLSPVPTTLTGASYTVDGGPAVSPVTLSAAGAFTIPSGLNVGTHSVVVTTSGCATPITVPVVVGGPLSPLTTTDSATACDSYFWAVSNQTYTSGGTKTFDTTNGSGCTVTNTLNLTINQSTTSTLTTSACDTYTWGAADGTGLAYTESGTYTKTTTNASGCPHVATLNLTINHSTTSTLTASGCATYTWNAADGSGLAYTTGGTYTKVTTNAAGCTHTATLNLTINPLPTANAGGALAAICQSSTSAALGGSFGGSATGAVWSDGGAGGSFSNNNGSSPSTATYTASASAVSPITLTLTTTGGPCSTATASKSLVINAGTLYFTDADGDGFDSGAPQVSLCTPAAGFVLTTNGADCIDSDAEINPNHVEVLGNGKDDNCDGAIDEVTKLSYLQPSQCGTVMPHIANILYAFQVFEAQGYRFEVTGPTGPARTYDSATSSFTLGSLAGGVAYNTTYSIRVALKIGGFWRAYSTSCSITTPAVPATTNIVPAQCGVTLTSLSNIIYANQVTAASQYRYEISGGTQGVRTFDSSLNRFTLGNFAGSASYGTTYSIRVALFIGGAWQAYGTSCSITTPLAPPATTLQPSQCGTTISNSWTTIYAIPVSEATGYRFEVFNGAITQYIDTNVPRFNIHQIPAGYTAGTAYTVRVAILFGSVYQAFGTSCTFNTAAVLTKQAGPADTVFAVKAYPNPFAENFKLDLQTSTEGPLEVKVYDMIGKLVETRQVSVADMATQEVGAKYPSGVYNIIVTQGENVKTLRVIKR